MTVFGSHYRYMQPGCYLFLRSPTTFDTRSLHDGVYDLIVIATDIRGNSSTRSRRFTVQNSTGAPADRQDARESATIGHIPAGTIG